MVCLLLPFPAGQSNLLSIDNNNEIPGIGMRGKGRLVFSPQSACYLTGQSAEGQIGGIHQIPAAIFRYSFGTHCLHGSAPDKDTSETLLITMVDTTCQAKPSRIEEKVKNPDPKDPISGFQVSGVRCQEKET
jgi:hypothetical protein